MDRVIIPHSRTSLVESLARLRNTESWGGLSRRVILLASVLALEVVAASAWSAHYRSEIGGLPREVLGLEERMCKTICSFTVVFSILTYANARGTLRSVSKDLAGVPVQWSFLAGHLVGLSIYMICSAALFGGNVVDIWANVVALTQLLAGLTASVLVCLSAVPLNGWWRLIRSNVPGVIYSLLAAKLISMVGVVSQALWESSDWISSGLVKLTFVLVSGLLHPFVSHVITDPEQMVIGTGTFSVTIIKYCSGFEGMGLIFVFTVIWLTVFRQEYAFPQAFVLVPAAVLATFLLNSVRITVLILIGGAGYGSVALGGFHSQAGWICFIAVALTISGISRRIQWLTQGQTKPAAIASTWTADPTIAYLLPFLAIIATGMLVRASSADFEWLYPLRVITASAALIFFRHTYTSLDWKCGWIGPTVGALAFVIWVALGASLNDPVPMPVALASASPIKRCMWITIRILAAFITVPIAEELAFRGFLLRRAVSREFQRVHPQTFTWAGLLLSSIAFGVLHGRQWFAGIIVGLLYAAVLLRTGRIGESVMAHATTNGLLAGYVLVFHRWNFW
jgi:exosortase E/protease (VPEID-CTERM system)